MEEVWNWVTDKGWWLFEEHAGESLYCCAWTFKGDSGENLERKEEKCKESFCFLREHLNNHEQTIG